MATQLAIAFARAGKKVRHACRTFFLAIGAYHELLELNLVRRLVFSTWTLLVPLFHASWDSTRARLCSLVRGALLRCLLTKRLLLFHSFVPVYTDDTKRLGVMSIGFLLPNKDDPVVWRGPKKNGTISTHLCATCVVSARRCSGFAVDANCIAVIKNFMEDVAWGDIDYLIIDTPPGTSDEHISTIEHLAAYTPDGAVLVTTPQVRLSLHSPTHLAFHTQRVSETLVPTSFCVRHTLRTRISHLYLRTQGVATSDVQRELSFCEKTNLPVLGVVENMSGFYCPTCSVRRTRGV